MLSKHITKHMKTLATQKRAAILRCLIEGNSILSTSRITGAAKNTIVDFLAKAGEACTAYHDEHMRNLKTKVLQLDEIHSFVGCRDKVKDSAKGEHPGDVWLWTSLDSESKLIPSWRCGDRSGRTAVAFCHDLSKRFSGVLQITSDGHPAYRFAVTGAFQEVHFAQLIKIYGKDADGKDVVIRTEKHVVCGDPHPDLISTSHIERSNLSIRMTNRRYTRLTNAFSKKYENHIHMIALSMMNYNFCRKHGSLKSTPAVTAGLTDHQWGLDEVVEMIDAYHKRKNDAMFLAAFDAKFTRPRTIPKSFPPRKPKTPWYLDVPESGSRDTGISDVGDVELP